MGTIHKITWARQPTWAVTGPAPRTVEVKCDCSARERSFIDSRPTCLKCRPRDGPRSPLEADKTSRGQRLRTEAAQRGPVILNSPTPPPLVPGSPPRVENSSSAIECTYDPPGAPSRERLSIKSEDLMTSSTNLYQTEVDIAEWASQ